MKQKTIGLLAPAGNFESLAAALKSGADAVYFGVGSLNMRAHATANFEPEDLPDAVARCHSAGAEAYLALNTVLYDTELPEAEQLLETAEKAGVDAVIAGDFAVIQAARRHGLRVHLSVQAGISNLEAVRFYAAYADVMVLARELNLEQIAFICRGIREQRITGPSGNPVKIEIFAHGALCVAISGKCYMSLASCNSSANRGACFQSCRRSYTVRDTVNGTEFELDHQYVMSPGDLCTVDILERFIAAGVSLLKIEGRGRSADYVAVTTGVYREALDRVLRGDVLSPEQIAGYRTRLSGVFNRGFWHGGYYLGEKVGEWAKSGENRSSMKKEFVGSVVNYFSKANVVEIKVLDAGFSKGDLLLIVGPTTGAERVVVEELQVMGSPVEQTGRGGGVTFPIAEKVRPGDKVYRLTSR